MATEDAARPMIDWGPHDAYPENTIVCQCGATFRSHSKHVRHEGRFLGVTRKPCPGCNRTEGHIMRASSDVETITLGVPDGRKV